MPMLNFENYRQKPVAETIKIADNCIGAARKSRMEESHGMKKWLLNGVFTALLLALSAHASAQQLSGAAGKDEQAPQKATEALFLSENATAMRKMMKDMAVKPVGDVDTDFIAMMIPHHQGAVDMAQAELNYGHNKKLRQIARNIIDGQRQQIGAMRAALDRPLPDTASTDQPDHASEGSATATSGMAQGSPSSMQMEH